MCFYFRVHVTMKRLLSGIVQWAGEPGKLPLCFHRTEVCSLGRRPPELIGSWKAASTPETLGFLESNTLDLPMDITHGERSDGCLQESHIPGLGRPGPPPGPAAEPLLPFLTQTSFHSSVRWHMWGGARLYPLIYDVGASLAGVFQRSALGMVHHVYINQINIHCHCPLEQLYYLC